MKYQCFFFPKWTVSTVKGSIFTTIVRRQGGQLFRFVIKEFLGLLKTFQTQDIAFNMWKIVKKKLKCFIVAQKVKNAQFLLKSQESVQESWKCKIMLQIQKSAEKVPRTIGKCLLLGTNIQNTCGGIKIPKYRRILYRPG